MRPAGSRRRSPARPLRWSTSRPRPARLVLPSWRGACSFPEVSSTPLKERNLQALHAPARFPPGQAPRRRTMLATLGRADDEPHRSVFCRRRSGRDPHSTWTRTAAVHPTGWIFRRSCSTRCCASRRVTSARGCRRISSASRGRSPTSSTISSPSMTAAPPRPRECVAWSARRGGSRSASACRAPAAAGPTRSLRSTR